eukprot:jgi/Bigna1/67445/fgenesh1_pg.3_\
MASCLIQDTIIESYFYSHRDLESVVYIWGSYYLFSRGLVAASRTDAGTIESTPFDTEIIGDEKETIGINGMVSEICEAYSNIHRQGAATTCVCILSCPPKITLIDICRIGEKVDASSLREQMAGAFQMTQKKLATLFIYRRCICWIQHYGTPSFFRSYPPAAFSNTSDSVGGVKIGINAKREVRKTLPPKMEITMLSQEEEREKLPRLVRLKSDSSPLEIFNDTRYFELPTCPVCLERLDSHISGMLMPKYPKPVLGPKSRRMSRNHRKQQQQQQQHLVGNRSSPEQSVHHSSSSLPSRQRWDSHRCRVCETVMLHTHLSMCRPSPAAAAAAASGDDGDDLEKDEKEDHPTESSSPQATAKKETASNDDNASSARATRDSRRKHSGPLMAAREMKRYREASTKLVLNCKECLQVTDMTTKSGKHEKKALWICLICGHLGCGRFGKSHAVRHWEKTKHRFSLMPKSEAIWDYEGDGYVHRLLHTKTQGFRARYTFSGEIDENGDLLTSIKLKAISGHYNHLLKMLLTKQQEHYKLELHLIQRMLNRNQDELRSEEARGVELKRELIKVEKATKNVNKKLAAMQGKSRFSDEDCRVQKEIEQVDFLKDLNDTLLKDQSNSAKKIGGGKIESESDGQQASDSDDCDRRIELLQEQVKKLMKELDDE